MHRLNFLKLCQVIFNSLGYYQSLVFIKILTDECWNLFIVSHAYLMVTSIFIIVFHCVFSYDLQRPWLRINFSLYTQTQTPSFVSLILLVCKQIWQRKQNLQAQIPMRFFVNMTNLRTTNKLCGFFSMLKDSSIMLPTPPESLLRGRKKKKKKKGKTAETAGQHSPISLSTRNGTT